MLDFMRGEIIREKKMMIGIKEDLTKEGKNLVFNVH
jgi:hypothetical protein